MSSYLQYKTTLSCLFVILFGFVGQSQEICNNLIDDDGDGLVDMFDLLDCPCIATPFNLVPNASFEYYKNNPPVGYGSPGYFEAEGWETAFTSGSADLFNVNSFTGYNAANSLNPPIPYPEGTGCMGMAAKAYPNNEFFSEPVMIDLCEPMKMGVVYEFGFWVAYGSGAENMDIGLYGVSFSGFSGMSNYLCLDSEPGISLQATGSFSVSPNSGWTYITTTFMPSMDIYTLIFSLECQSLVQAAPLPNGNFHYYFFDALHISEIQGPEISATGDFCNGQLTLTTNLTTTADYVFQWYVNEVSISGASNASLVIDQSQNTDGTYTCIAQGPCSQYCMTYEVEPCSDPIIIDTEINDENEGEANVIWIPNAFTPDGDEYNNQFVTLGHNVQDFHLEIFNRWGEEIFESYSMLDTWDGTYQGKIVPTGMYSWKLIYSHADSGGLQQKCGHVTVIY